MTWFVYAQKMSTHFSNLISFVFVFVFVFHFVKCFVLHEVDLCFLFCINFKRIDFWFNKAHKNSNFMGVHFFF
jgi:hypothetical protein